MNDSIVPLVHRRMSQHNECVILCPRLFYFKYQSDDGAESMINKRHGRSLGRDISERFGEKGSVCGPVQGAVLA